MKKIVLLSCLALVSTFLHAQLALTKMIGKNAKHYKTPGFGVFLNYDIPLTEYGNRSLMIELMDLAYFPPKDASVVDGSGYLSIKLGYRYIFSEEGRTGFYIEPQAGWCRVVMDHPDKDYGDGIAAAIEAGHSFEVGQGGNSIAIGLKYEADMGGKDFTIHSLGLRFSFSFPFLRRDR